MLSVQFSVLLAVKNVCLCLSEMAEHHNAEEILRIARDLVYKVQTLIENK